MIRLLIVLLVGIGIGYTYGYLQGDAGDDNLITTVLTKVGLQHATDPAEGSVSRLRKDELQRQAKIDSIKQARIDSISSAVHH